MDGVDGRGGGLCNKSKMARHASVPNIQQRVEEEEYGEWMVVERQPRRQGRNYGLRSEANKGKSTGGSRFNILSNVREDKEALQDQN